jgi:hypothetical protein
MVGREPELLNDRGPLSERGRGSKQQSGYKA